MKLKNLKSSLDIFTSKIEIHLFSTHFLYDALTIRIEIQVKQTNKKKTNNNFYARK